MVFYENPTIADNSIPLLERIFTAIGSQWNMRQQTEIQLFT